MDSEKRRPGRPKSEKPIKEKRVTFRMDDSEYQELKEFSEGRGLTVTETINAAIKMYYVAKSK